MISLEIRTPRGRLVSFALTTSKTPQVCVECGSEIPPKTEHYRKFFMVHVESEEYDGLSRRWDGKRLCQSCTPPEGCVIVRRWEA
jgi:hypothetical protein